MKYEYNYFKENLKKLIHDNIIHFLFDLILRVDLMKLKILMKLKQYVLNQKSIYKRC